MSGDRSHKQPSDGTSDPCVQCGHSTAFGSGRFVNRIPADGGWGCALCFEECGYENATGYVCHDCADVDDLNDAHERGLHPVWAEDIDGRGECRECGRVLHDWTNWNDA